MRRCRAESITAPESRALRSLRFSGVPGCRVRNGRWGGVEAGDGFSAAELEAAERALGFSIPPLLRDFHDLSGKRQDALRLQDSSACTWQGGYSGCARPWQPVVQLLGPR